MKTTTKNLARLIALMLALLTLASVSLISCQEPEQPAQSTPDSGDNGDAPQYEVITIAKALELCGEPGNITEDRYYIRGTIETIKNAQYGQMVIKDETGSIEVYGTFGPDGEKTYLELEYSPVKGDEVLLHCILQNYNGTKEVKNARLIEYKKGDIDVSGYTSASITEARAAEKGTNLKVDGVVSCITYANGKKPNGFILVDEGASIYVFDADAAQRVQIGNKVEIAGTKDFWILDSEQANAAEFGYKGSNQLTDVTLVSNDNKTDNKFDTTWIEETTVKDIIETPVTEDITSIVYKVNALVKKVPGDGFVNYYFFDLDGETGAYTYTQCNGSDFDWLDKFDGKICTVYLTALNAKSTPSSCFFRLLPVAVYDEDFRFDLNATAEHVVKYYGVGQFASSYAANPNLELITKVSSELLGFTDATITYTSDNTASVKFTEAEGKLVMECLAPGKANVTVSVTYNGKTYSETVEITVEESSSAQGSDVKTAIDTALNETVTVEGIVGPSLVNKDGFYLIDNTGIIAVVVQNREILGEIELGNKVVIKGKRDKFHNGAGDHAGQTCITGATVEANYYGKHDYDKSNFVTDKTLADFRNLDIKVDYSTTVFVLKATITTEGNNFYTNYVLSDGTNRVTLYAGSGKTQYKCLEPYIGQEVTIEVAACNWNNKTYYTGCMLSITAADGTVVYNTLCFDAN